MQSSKWSRYKTKVSLFSDFSKRARKLVPRKSMSIKKTQIKPINNGKLFTSSSALYFRLLYYLRCFEIKNQFFYFLAFILTFDLSWKNETFKIPSIFNCNKFEVNNPSNGWLCSVLDFSKNKTLCPNTISNTW